MKSISAALVIAAGLLLMPMAGAETFHISHCSAGCPDGTPESNEILVRNLYAVSINQQSGLADWVAYRVLQATVGVASLLPREWRAESLVHSLAPPLATVSNEPGGRQPLLENSPEQVYRLTEFRINASDQGRLVPMTSFAGTSYWQDLNYLSVMSPLKADMRGGAWSRLDQAINQLAQTAGEVFVLAGPLFAYHSPATSAITAVGDIPAAYFKVVVDSGGRVSAFVFDQSLPRHAAFCDQISDLDSVEQISNLRLFPEASEWPRGSLNEALGCQKSE